MRLGSRSSKRRPIVASSLVHTPESTVSGLQGRLAEVSGFYSDDGGKRWSQAFHLDADMGNAQQELRESYFDPTVCFGPDGIVHFAVMFGRGFEHSSFRPEHDGDQPQRPNHRVDFWRSYDAGATWRQRPSIPRFIDRPFTIVDTSRYSGGRQYTIGQDNDVFVFTHQGKDADNHTAERIDLEVTNPRLANPIVLRDRSVLFAVENYARKWLGTVRPGAARQIVTFRYTEKDGFVTGSEVNTRWSHKLLETALDRFFHSSRG